MQNTVWILTREHNEYNQEGRYFVAVFAKNPSIQTLAPHLANLSSEMGIAISQVEHVRQGGGRKCAENVWYVLEEIDLIQ